MMSWGGRGEEEGWWGRRPYWTLFLSTFCWICKILKLTVDEVIKNYPNGHIQLRDRRFHRHTGAPESVLRV